MPRCASGDACLMPNGPLLLTHACPLCNLAVHGICGEENEAASGVYDKTVCFLCSDQGVKPPAKNVKKRPFLNNDRSSGGSLLPDEKSSSSSDDEQVIFVKATTALTTATGTIKNKDPKNPVKKTKKHDLRDLYSHFENLGHRFISPLTGKEQTHWACVCIYSKNAYEKAVRDGCIIPRPKKPVEIPRYREGCSLHLKSCTLYSNQEKLRSVFASSQEVAVYVPKSGPPPADDGIMSMTPASAAASRSTTRSAKACGCNCHDLGSGNLKSYFVPPMKQQQVDASHSFLMEMIVDCAMPFRIVERGSFRRYVESLRPEASLQLPDLSIWKAEKFSRNLWKNLGKYISTDLPD